jgi:hypothetical protein
MYDDFFEPKLGNYYATLHLSLRSGRYLLVFCDILAQKT